MPVKRIVCLANSRKHSGRCLAGKEWEGPSRGAWVRPVSARPGQEVSDYERRYADGSDPRVLDVIDVPLLSAQPQTYQRENWLLNPNSRWVSVGHVDWGDLAVLEDVPGVLWANGNSTYNGLNDRVTETVAQTFTNSLRLIRVDEMTLVVSQPGAAFGNPKRRVQGRFVYAGVEYHLWTTDPIYEQQYCAMGDGHYTGGPVYLAVSLSEPHNGDCYKLIAAIIERP